ncbi:hypothetical protein AJ79_02544 [Helicocarpus griseus UAMH5409]|uniref:Uncharacterized protein n=1 Tax=Helicocarpus griseus UAMH5409 TaxID=1447875 RepID=A0A2B7Y215_9EURO|nr:hypothetical protein AJ79_02544 [Helicocarpus griseus UAMH5409]
MSNSDPPPAYSSRPGTPNRQHEDIPLQVLPQSAPIQAINATAGGAAGYFGTVPQAQPVTAPVIAPQPWQVTYPNGQAIPPAYAGPSGVGVYPAIHRLYLGNTPATQANPGGGHVAQNAFTVNPQLYQYAQVPVSNPAETTVPENVAPNAPNANLNPPNPVAHPGLLMHGHQPLDFAEPESGTNSPNPDQPNANNNNNNAGAGDDDDSGIHFKKLTASDSNTAHPVMPFATVPTVTPTPGRRRLAARDKNRKHH